MNPVKPNPIARYYRWLAWGHHRRGVFRGVGPVPAVHRRLVDEVGGVSADADILHARLLAALASGRPGAEPLRVLDAGCGLGATSFLLHEQLGAATLGLTLSPVQAARATGEAAHRGVAGACRFLARNYDDDLRDLLPAGADLVVAIESLAHAPDPAGTIGRWAALLRPGGRIAVVDDMPAETLPLSDPDFAAFRRGWLCPAPASRWALQTAMASAGLAVTVDDDLTPLVPKRLPPALTARLLAVRAAAMGLGWTPAGVLLDAWHGGLCLERLYARGAMRYGLMVATRTAVTAP